MSEHPYIENQSRGSMLRGWVLTEMLRGAGYAAVVLFVIGMSIYAIHLFGMLLPEESKTAPAPMGSVIEAPMPGATALSRV